MSTGLKIWKHIPAAQELWKILGCLLLCIYVQDLVLLEIPVLSMLLNASNLEDVFIFNRVALQALMLDTGRRMGGNWVY